MMTGIFDRLSTTLVLLSLLLGITLYHADVQPSPSAAASNPPSQRGLQQMDDGRPVIDAIPAMPELSHAFVERPLFNAHRRRFQDTVSLARPVDALSEDGGPMPTEPRDLKILGVFGLEGKPVALIRHGRGGDIQKIRIGHVIEGWRVTDIGAQGITLKQGEHRFSVFLYPVFDIAK